MNCNGRCSGEERNRDDCDQVNQSDHKCLQKRTIHLLLGNGRMPAKSKCIENKEVSDPIHHIRCVEKDTPYPRGRNGPGVRLVLPRIRGSVETEQRGLLARPAAKRKRRENAYKSRLQDWADSGNTNLSARNLDIYFRAHHDAAGCSVRAGASTMVAD